MSNWLPIETAPNEHARRLLVCANSEIGVWYKDSYYSKGIGRGYEEGMTGWVDQEGVARYDSPTHWMPLPEAPRSAPETDAASEAPAPRLERERELADQLAAALKDLMKYSAWVSVTSAKCEDALAQYAAMRAKESSSTAEQSHPQSSTTS